MRRIDQIAYWLATTFLSVEEAGGGDPSATSGALAFLTGLGVAPGSRRAAALAVRARRARSDRSDPFWSDEEATAIAALLALLEDTRRATEARAVCCEATAYARAILSALAYDPRRPEGRDAIARVERWAASRPERLLVPLPR